MLEFIKKNRNVLLVVIAVVSIGVNVYLLSDSRIKKDIIHNLEQGNGFLAGQLNESKEKEKSYLKEINEKNKTISALDKKLAESVKKYKQLKAEIAAVRKPENPRNFKDLNECKEKYVELAMDFKLSMDFGKVTETSLTLCLEKSKEQQDVIALMDKAYSECQKQGELKDLKIDNFKKSLKDLERFYKRKRLKRRIFHGTVGAVIGFAAGYFILKKNR